MQGKSVVITGAGRGIGRRLALGFAEQGASVLVHYVRSQQGATSVVEQIRQGGGRAELYKADLQQVDDVKKLAQEAHRLFGEIDVWINNAGASANSSETRGLTDAAVLERLLAVDVMGTWHCCREARPYMRSGGCILTTGWDGALAGSQGPVSQFYAISKGAIISLTRCLAQEYAPEVRVNCIAPGYIENDWSSQLNSTTQQKIARRIPMQRWGTADDILGTALFLTSPAAAYITGQVILVNGGEIMR
jgi:3-oxoacyl-[acyl-carrier protein] reductase